MAEKKQKECPMCRGEKTLPGTCVCDSEWRGTQTEEDWNDCQCNPDIECTLCHGTGFILEE